MVLLDQQLAENERAKNNLNDFSTCLPPTGVRIVVIKYL